MPGQERAKMTTGTKYAETQGMNTTQIAALVRKELRAWQKRTAAVKAVKVTTDYFAGGSAIRVRLELDDTAGRLLCAAALVYAEDAVNQYNRQDIDSQSDYFNVRYYGTVSHNLGYIPRAGFDGECYAD
jgi:hypothetical protein